MNKKINQKGFTIVELMIVIMIIATLSGVLLGVVNASGVRSKSRDAQRKGDLSYIQTALELYFADNRAYPDSPLTATSLTGYISKLPVDPKASGTGSPCTSATTYNYWYNSNGSSYVLAVNMEIASSADDSKCVSSNLTNWGTLGCGTAPANCYGVQNP